ncbi:ATP-dependent RNA helicase HrpA [Propionicimonas sp.]|uniref:ATP-dependent RNA helicase HrpA n=1 Tax=Propionicimonas sp. TaxID=1955623 RepID=UPI00184E14CD|nr:ATP-dependent RNA helicase HrpA [Propionicimonas sp.]MBU3977250.1 ATP-dependent RNA helicase HrpA [Actinomycetota bacterium]MBA3021176.1 ATP-dependent RNA helicase HrpA [Propionicimonas sp.]MBU3985760.1 ATP-dependent RNA helicase HrpA [Actinomycetota bacterium]MBU4008545.1 ATP-dependent RNA helicase HrpA [Actinomycetota bacterium]MBU4066305.1 ATP-dependent RNA helicase HrpA [Actinomycetota bacterium]
MTTEPPQLAFDEALPISAHVEQISAALAVHQVLVVAGETGSGKTTQLPKICLLAGRKRIGHTQPRRLAARSVAARMAAELGEQLGQTIGFQVRFSGQRSAQTKVKVMTDGILLAEISHDRQLRRYDTIIIDEAHERSLNIDFLLGYLKQLLPKRPDLKVIITSATIDTSRFSAHFEDAPVIEVSGRTYPVEVRYRPVVDGAGQRDRDQVEAICDAVNELSTNLDGDILVFCSGEREIRDTAEAINALALRFTEVVPLYARLSMAEQQRVFSPHTGRRVVLATNVAETSLTVPGVRYVIDPGFARISRYSARTKVQRLPIEPISQASANQRAGRCGRLGPGVCIRLYSEEDFAARDEFTQPEILRTNLASVILQMADAGLGDIAGFPFVEPPDASQVRDGVRLLTELGAIGGGKAKHAQVRLTAVGRKLARLPVDPRLGRMLVEAGQLGCLREVLPIVAGIAIPDVRERPAAAEAAADASHRRFWAPMDGAAEPSPDGSDVAALWRLWRYLRDQRKNLSGNAFRRMCRDEYLNFLRVREWQDLHAQLRDACAEVELRRNDVDADFERVHTAVLAGLLSHIGLLDAASVAKPERGRRRGPAEYLGARGARFAINPGSSAARTKAELVMAVELVETSRLWARTVAPITAEQVEQVGGHLLKRHYSEPHWSANGGQCVAYERVSLLGVPIIAQRLVSYAKIDPVTAREVFIASALVEGQWHTRHHFWARNEAVRAEAEQLADRNRRRDLLVDDVTIAAFYDSRIPADVVSVAHFDRWWRDARSDQPGLLDLTLDDLVAAELSADDEQYPERWRASVGELAIDYAFDPGSGHDGVTVNVPLAALTRLSAADFTWQVPGLRGEVATELIRALPKQLRTQLVPAPDTARRVLEWLSEHPGPAGEPLWTALGRGVSALTGVQVPAQEWRPAAIPEHLQMRFRVHAEGAPPVVGRDLGELAERLAPKVSRTLNAAASHLIHDGATEWVFGVLPVRIDEPMPGFPALVDRVNRVGVQIFAEQGAAVREHRNGLRRLVTLTTVDPTRSVVARMSNPTKMALATSPYASVPALLADARLKVTGEAIDALGSAQQVRDADGFAKLTDAVRAEIAPAMQAAVAGAGEVLALAGEITTRLDGLPADTGEDVAEQLGGLVYPGFIAATPAGAWRRLPTYLRAIRRRIEGSRTNARQESAGLVVISELEDEYAQLCAGFGSGALPPAVAEVGWLMEELRVSLFAQALGTAVPVSAKRVRTAMAAARAGDSH